MTRINKLVLLLLLVPFGFASMAHAASDVVSQTPVNGALGVATTSAITVVFNRSITATTTNISFSPTIAFTFATSSATLTITPSVPFSNNTTYTLTLAGIKDAGGNILSSYTSQFTTKNNYSISIYNNSNGGLNLISLPVQPSNTAIASVLGSASSSIDSVWSYDPSNAVAPSSGWLVYYPAHPELSSLTTMGTGYGYWVTANADATLSGSGSLFTSTSTPPSRTVQSGWNLLGYYQLSGQSTSTSTGAFSSIPSYTTVVGYDNSTGVFKTVSSILPGDAFWLGIPSSGTYYPSQSFSSGNGSATFESPQPTGTITATKYTGYGAQTVVAGSNNAKLGAFTLSTDSTEGITVNTIAISMTAANAASITNLTLKNEATGTVLGNIVTTPSGSASVASGANNNLFNVNLDIAHSSTHTFGIYGNVLSNANAGPMIMYVDTGTMGIGDTTGIAASVTSEVTLQTITVGSGSLSVTRGAGDPVSNIVLAGASSIQVGQFNLSASNSSYTVQNLAILIPNGAATSVTGVTLSYKDVNGATQTQTQSLAVSAAMPFATATFTGLTMYIPVNDSANLDVYVGTPTIASGATSGTAINVALDTGATSGTFRAQNSAGAALTVVNAGAVIASNGTFYVRKSIPTFALVNINTNGTAVPTSGSPLYKFTITADPAGAIEWSKLTFNISTTTATVGATSLYLTDDASGNNLLDNTTMSASSTGSVITIDLTKNATQAQYSQVAAGATKTYDLYGSVSAYGAAGSTVTISLASDSGNVANNAPSTSGWNISWSDRSTAPHIAPAVGVTPSNDWTNGNLLKNFTSNSISYSK